MSLETWKAEFYPEPASEVPKERAVEHSLRKWRGLTKANLERHGLKAGIFGEITDGKDLLNINADSCALCRIYLLGYECNGCPIFESRNGIPCDQMKGRAMLSPYAWYTGRRNPQPMIKALELARKWERKRRKEPA